LCRLLQRAGKYFDRRYIHSTHPKGHETFEIHSLQSIQGIPPTCIPKNGYNFDKEKDGDCETPVQLSQFLGNIINVEKTTSGHES